MSNRRRFFVYTGSVAVPPDATHVLVHPSVEVLPSEAFRRCRLLKELVLSEGLLEIKAWAVGECPSLERVVFPDPSQCRLRQIGAYAFCCCTSLRRVAFSEGLITIDRSAFMHCSMLERISLPSSLATIGDRAFCGCSSLKDVALGEGIQTMGESIFFDCRLLEYISLPASLAAIGRHAFGKCKSLRIVRMFGGIQTHGTEMFRGCISLDDVKVSSKAVVVTLDRLGKLRQGDHPQGHRNYHFAADGTIPRNDCAQVVIVSECFNSMPLAEVASLETAIAGVLRLESRPEDTRARLCKLVAPYELQHRKKMATILELGLWKSKTEASNGGNPGAREDCRINCGACVIIPNVLSFI